MTDAAPKRLKRPSEILAMIAHDKQHIAQARHILKKRFGFTGAQIDIAVAAQLGQAPVAATHLALSVDGAPRPDPLQRRSALDAPRSGKIF